MKPKQLFLMGLVFLLLAINASAYTIVGNTVVQEDAFSKLVVSPFTIWNAQSTGPFTQNFELTNKTGSDQNVYVAYKFDNPVQSASVRLWNPPVYGWAPVGANCPISQGMHYDANLNYYPGQQNPNHIRCYQTIDLNNGGTTQDLNVLIFDKNFNTFNLGQSTIFTDYNVITSGNNWTTATSAFSTTTYLDDTVYYTTNPVLFQAGKSKKWEVTYQPNPADTTSKWEMVYYVGASANCIVNGTCTYSQWLDPWWDNTWTAKVPITLTNLQATILQNYRANIQLNSIGATFWSNLDTNGNCLRFTNSTQSHDLNYFYRSYTDNSDANVIVRLDENIGASSTLTIYAYLKDASCAVKSNLGNTVNWYDDFDTNKLGQYSWRSVIAPGSTGSIGTLGLSSNQLVWDSSGAGFYGQIQLINRWPDYPVNAMDMNVYVVSTNNADPGDTVFSGKLWRTGTAPTDLTDQSDPPVPYIKVTQQSLATQFSEQDYSATNTTNPYISMDYQDQSAAHIAQATVDNFWYLLYTTPEPTVSFSPIQFFSTIDVNINFPNAPGLAFSGIHDFNIYFTDSNFSVTKKYDINISARRESTGISTHILTDGNAFVYCSNMDVNTTTKKCLYTFNFSTLTPGVNYFADVNINNGINKTITSGSNTFNISQIAINVDYNGFGTNSAMGKKYTNTLNYDVNAVCYSGGAGTIQRYINSQNDMNQDISCDGLNHHTYNSYQGPTNGANFFIHFLVSDPSISQTAVSNDLNFFTDTTNPIATLTNTPLSNGFGTTLGDINLNLRCVDAVSPKVDYNIIRVSSDVNYLFGRFDANTIHSTTIPLISSVEIFRGVCTDLAGNQDVDFNTTNVQVNCFRLVDETSGAALTSSDINNFTNLSATSYNTHATYNFKTLLTPSICFSGVNGDTIRFDLNYSDGTQLYREFNQNVLLNYDANVNVCVADAQSFFEQDFTSSKNTAIVLRHQISGCFNAADYTKYAENDALSLRAFTIVGPYTMETFDSNGNKIVLSQLNGGTPSAIQVDILQFKLGQVPINVLSDFLGISLYLPPSTVDSNTLKIYYVNLQKDNAGVQIKINDNSSTIFDYNEFTNPNQFVVYFDHTNVHIDGNVLTVIITKTKNNGTVVSETKYFTLNGIIVGAKGVFGSGEGLGAMIAIIIFLFGFTLVAPKFALGWFGIIISIISLIILTLSSQAWYVLLLQAVFIIIGLYLGLTYKDVHAGVS